MLKWVLIVVGVLVALVLVMLVIGLLLPKGHVASVRVRLRQSPEVVWATLTDFERWSEWNSFAKRMERGGEYEGKPVWKLVSSHGEMPLAVMELDEPRRMVTKIASNDLPFGGTWIYEIDATEDGCDVRVTENGEIFNPFFRFMSRCIFGYHKTLEDFTRSLGAKFGENITPERVGA